MSILTDFDTAIAEVEKLPKGYCVEGRLYESYLSNDMWKEYLADMSEEHYKQYSKGSGGELEEKNGRPPKMASFASSSRLIYRLSKNIPGFVFEKQLSTVVGGTANLDGYLEGEQKLVFVEAKCREPYSHTAIQVIKQNYRPIYTYLREKMPRVFNCVMEDVAENRNMQVVFFCKGELVVYFDIKQMICHMLGVANEVLKNKADKSILFLYLLYNPNELQMSLRSKEEIAHIYADTCAVANGYHMEEMFGHIVDFLIQRDGTEVDKQWLSRLKESFQFILCDQNDYITYVKE